MKIETEEKEVVPFILNKAQNIYLNIMSRFDTILKYRKLGMTTLLQAISFLEAAYNPNTHVELYAQEIDTVESKFLVYKRFIKNL